MRSNLNGELSLIVSALALCAQLVSAEEAAITRYTDDATDRVPTHTMVPTYPRTARRDRIEGKVQVCYYVDKKGRPYSVAVRESTHRVFERPARSAAKASRYKPLEPGATFSGLKTCRTFTFELDPILAGNENKKD